MSQLHEVLVVDRPLEETANKMVAEAVNTFTKKAERFSGHNKRLEFFDDVRAIEAESFNESKRVEETVPSKLEYVATHLAKHVDALAQKEVTNQKAKADIVLSNGEILVKDVPATLLLALENKIGRWRDMYLSIPTLPPGVAWSIDGSTAPDVYKNQVETVRNKTEKVNVHKEVSPATKEHKAQIVAWVEDKPVGQFHITDYSGAISVADKSATLSRLDELFHSVKKARMRANKEEVVKFKVGEKLLQFINGF